jgi:hypothetical protein
MSCFEEACQDRGVLFDKNEQHVRCICHVANLAVQAFMDKLGAEASGGDASLNDDTARQPKKLRVSKWPKLSHIAKRPKQLSHTPKQPKQLPCIAKLHHLVKTIRDSSQHREKLKVQCFKWSLCPFWSGGCGDNVC